MSLSDRRSLLAALVLLPLGACGFRPVHGARGAVQALRGQIMVAAPSSRDAFELVDQLERRLGRPDVAQYDLSYRISTETEKLAITDQQEITRYNVVGRIRYQLIERQSGAVISAGSESNFTSYSATSSSVATQTSKRDAFDRLMRILADQIVTRLMADLGSRG